MRGRPHMIVPLSRNIYLHYRTDRDQHHGVNGLNLRVSASKCEDYIWDFSRGWPPWSFVGSKRKKEKKIKELEMSSSAAVTVSRSQISFQHELWSDQLRDLHLLQNLHSLVLRFLWIANFNWWWDYFMWAFGVLM